MHSDFLCSLRPSKFKIALQIGPSADWGRGKVPTYLGATLTRLHAAPHAEARRLTDCCVACMQVSYSI